MRQQVFIILGLVFLTVLLAGLNAATYVQKEKMPDSESSPNRSTYNNGATGLRAFYDLLAETGRRPMRWQQPVAALASGGADGPSTFVVVGRTRREFGDDEIESLLNWVSRGNRLVIIDREPPGKLVRTTANWSVAVSAAEDGKIFGIDPSDPNQMTQKTAAAKPVQPSIFTADVNAVQPSKLASTINIEKLSGEAAAETSKSNTGIGSMPAPTPENDSSDAIDTPAQTAPVVHVADAGKNLLVDFPFGSGQIVFLTDPYIVSNGGINLVDNARLAINVVASGGGIVAFDEYHQGYGANNNRFLEYFDGTPLVAFFLQFAVLAGLIAITQSRRFARPLPENEPNRLSKLEYVSAMAELQQRTKAFDLAVENIYTDFRRRAAKHFGAGNAAVSNNELAKSIAERTGDAASELENLFFKCEEIVRGEPTNKKEVLHLTSRLRRIEETLGLQRRNRADKIV